MHEEDDQGHPVVHRSRRNSTAEFNEMAVAVAAAISMWAAAMLVAVIAGYHGSGPTNTVNLITVAAGVLGFAGRRWQLKRQQRP